MKLPLEKRVVRIVVFCVYLEIKFFVRKNTDLTLPHLVWLYNSGMMYSHVNTVLGFLEVNL